MFYSLYHPVCFQVRNVSNLISTLDKSGKWFEAGRTEKLKDTLSPEWITRIPVDYFENEDSTCKFVVYDFDKNNTDLKKATFLGQYICDFGDIIKGGEKFRQECPMTAQDGESKLFSSKMTI